MTYSSIHGRLRKFVDFWHTLEVLQFISNVIVQGYKIPFFELLMPFLREKNTSACKPDIINPLSVSNLRSGKQRLILDLRHVKKFIHKQKLKFEDFGYRNYYSGFWQWGFKIFSVLSALFQALFSSIYFYINLEAITEIVEEPGHPYGYFLDDSLGGGTQCFLKLTV